MNKQEKSQFVKNWGEEIKGVPFAVLVDYRGLGVTDATDLRGKIRETNSSYKVVKNTLAQLAVPGTTLEKLEKHFVGPIAIAYSNNNPVDLAKVLVEFSEQNTNFEIKVGLMDGQLLDSSQITELSKMPSRDELLAKLVYLMQYPIRGLATALSNIISNLAKVLGQVANGKKTEISSESDN